MWVMMTAMLYDGEGDHADAHHKCSDNDNCDDDGDRRRWISAAVGTLPNYYCLSITI